MTVTIKLCRTELKLMRLALVRLSNTEAADQSHRTEAADLLRKLPTRVGGDAVVTVAELQAANEGLGLDVGDELQELNGVAGIKAPPQPLVEMPPHESDVNDAPPIDRIPDADSVELPGEA